MFVCVIFFHCLFFIPSTPEIQWMPFSPFPYLFFSTQPAKSHRTSLPLDSSDVEMLFLLFQPQKGNLFMCFLSFCKPVLWTYQTVMLLSFSSSALSRIFVANPLLSPSMPVALLSLSLPSGFVEVCYCAADASGLLEC